MRNIQRRLSDMEKAQKENIEQRIYERLLKDDNLTCTCDEIIREDTFFQAKGHYHTCMLYQVTRSIEITLKAMESEVK